MKILEPPRKIGHVWVTKVSGTLDDYLVEYNEVTGEWKCSCLGFRYRKHCSHIDYVKRRFFSRGQKDLFGRRVDNMKLIKGKEIDEGNVVREATCGLKLLDRAFGKGFFSTDTMNAIFGSSTAGKTIFAIETAVHRIAQGDNVLYIDTEGGASSLWKYWAGRLAEKYGIDKKTIWDRLYLVVLDEPNDFYKLLGFEVEKTIKKSKVEISITEFYKEKCGKYFNMPRKLKECKDKHNIVLLDDLVKEFKIKHLVIDSFSLLIEHIPSSVQNFSPRADITKNMFIELNKLQRKHNITMLLLHKSSKNPMAMDTRENMFGGRTVWYFSKRIVYIDYPTKKALEKYRRFWVIRAETRPRWSDVAVYRLTEKGFVEPSEVEIEELKSDIFTGAEERYGARIINTDEELTLEILGIDPDEEILKVKQFEEDDEEIDFDLE